MRGNLSFTDKKLTSKDSGTIVPCEISDLFVK